MVQLKCTGCGREITTSLEEDEWSNKSCSKCHKESAFVLKSEYDAKEDDEYDEDEEETFECQNCGEEFTKEEVIFFDEGCDDDDYNIIVCKRCFNKKVGNIKPQIEYVEKIVEVPVLVDEQGNRIKTTTSVFQKVF